MKFKYLVERDRCEVVVSLSTAPIDALVLNLARRKRSFRTATTPY
jgi:hypothetical protein